MLNIYTVSFFGHREIEHPFWVELRLEKIIRALIGQKEYVEFLVGRNGEFDQLVASTVLQVRRTVGGGNSSLIWVLPYLMSEFVNNRASFENYYDSIEISEAATGAHFKAAIQIRNHEMIDRSDLVVCYVERKSGGAYQSVQYARKKGKKTINLAEDSPILE